MLFIESGLNPRINMKNEKKNRIAKNYRNSLQIKEITNALYIKLDDNNTSNNY